MVQKISKRGVHSGNTIRASNSRLNQYKRRSCLLRKSWNHTKLKETILDDMNINQDDLIYSLNKKGRWQLPKILKDSILEGKYKYSNSNIKLLISHNISQKSHATVRYASKGKTRKVESQKQTYFNGESVIVKRSQDDKRAEQGEQPVLQVEVVYPCPTTSSVVHNPKYVGVNIDKSDSGSGRTTKSRKQRQKLTVGKYCEEFDDKYLHEFDESDTEADVEEEISKYIYGNSCNEAATYTELLEDLMVHAALMQSICEKRNQNIKPYSQPKLEAKDKKIGLVSHDTVVSIKKTMVPVYVVLLKEELEHEHLKERYGKHYIECPCFPRKFVIDISDRMKHRVKTSWNTWKKEYAGIWDLTSCVVFSYDAYDVNNRDTHNVYKVCLNMGTVAENFRILTMFDYFEGSIEDVLQRAVVFLDTLSTDGFIEKEKEPPKELMTVKFENLNRYQNVQKEIKFVSRKSLYTEIFDTCDKYSNDNAAYDKGFECICVELCGICFEPITEGEKSGTALDACGHWFCDECWISHCRSRRNMGSETIFCPEHKCSEIVHESVLLAFINIFEVLDIKRRANDIAVQSSDNINWCPNPQCGRVIKVTNPEKAVDITCQCGMQLCFQCLRQSHWPVSCKRASLYWKKLKRLGDDNLVLDMSMQVRVRGKQCPKCKRFVEKRGGCFYMSCMCGAKFCWGCLGLYPGHTITDNCNQHKNGDLKGTETLTVTVLDGYANISNQNRSDDYNKALNHRKARHPLKIRKLNARVREINFKCKNMVTRKGPLYFPMFSGESEVEQKIQDLLFDMVSVYVELHHIAEYSYILLEKLNTIGTKCSEFRSTVDCLGSYAEEIFALLSSSGNTKDFRSLITSLLKFQQKSGDLTKAVVHKAETFEK